MKKKVFLSHQKADSITASIIANDLRNARVPVYLDLIDSSIEKDTGELSEYIKSVMDECGQLLVVFSQSTKQSWWV